LENKVLKFAFINHKLFVVERKVDGTKFITYLASCRTRQQSCLHEIMLLPASCTDPHTYTCAHTQTLTHIPVHTHTHKPSHINLCTRMHARTHTHTHTQTLTVVQTLTHIPVQTHTHTIDHYGALSTFHGDNICERHSSSLRLSLFSLLTNTLPGPCLLLLLCVNNFVAGSDYLKINRPSVPVPSLL